MERGAVMVLEHEGDVRMAVRQPTQVVAGKLADGRGVIRVRQATEEQAKLMDTELAGDLYLARDRLERRLDLRCGVEEVTPASRKHPDAESSRAGRLRNRRYRFG